MDFDKPKVCGDTSITDGLVYFLITQTQTQTAPEVKASMWWPSASTHTLRMRCLPASSRYLYFPNTNTALNITNTTLNIADTTLNIANTIPHIITNTCDEKAMQLQVHTL